MRTALWGFHMAHLGSTSLFGLYLAMGGVLAPSQRQCMLGWGVVTNSPSPLSDASCSFSENFSLGNSDRADDYCKYTCYPLSCQQNNRGCPMFELLP